MSNNQSAPDPTPTPASGATVAALDLDAIEGRSATSVEMQGTGVYMLHLEASADDVPALVAEVRQSRETVAALQSEVERLRVREQHAIEYERRIVWDTTCGTCATTLDNAYADTARAEAAEAERDALAEQVAKVREVLTNPLTLDGMDVVVVSDIRAALDGGQR